MDNSFLNPGQEERAQNWLDQFQGQAEKAPEYPSKPFDVADQVNALPNAEKLSPTEKWLYGTMTGISNSAFGQAMGAFGNTPTGKALSAWVLSPAGKLLSVLDVGAEGLERTLGVIAQYRDLDENETMRLKDAWTAGSLFYDTVKLPRVQYDENGNATGVRIDTDAPGAIALTEARKLLESGKTLEEVRETMYSNMGALALRAQLNDTLGHVALDPLNWMLLAVKPVERLHAIRHLALSGKMDVEYVRGLEQAARVAGNLEDAEKFAQAITKAEETGKAMSRFDRFAIAATGGTPWLDDVTKASKTKNLLGRLNPFALSPQAKANELMDVVASNVGEYLIRPMWNAEPEDFIKALGGAARGGIGTEWGHLASTVQGRTVQAFLSNAEGTVKSLGVKWKTYEAERNLLARIASAMPGMDERKLWQFAQKSPESLFKRVLAAAQQPGGEVLMAELKSGGVTQEILSKIGKLSNDIPLMRDEFMLQALDAVKEVAIRQSVLQFGVKEKGLITKWADSLKAWESIPFIKANPANAIRNVVNNEVTLIGRGLFGFWTPNSLKKMWEGKWIPPQFHRAFGLGTDSLDNIADDLAQFNPGNAMRVLSDALEGSKGLAGKVKEAAGKVPLGPADFSKYSARAEKFASMQASTMGWMQFHNKYWNPRTGFTSVTKSLDPATLEQIEKIAPGLSDILDDVAQASGADSAKFAELMESNLEHNISSVFKNASDRLGYNVDDVLGTEVMHAVQSGLPEAIQKGKVPEFIDGVRAQMEQHVDDMFNSHLENLPGIVAAQVQAGGPMQYHRIFAKATDEFWGGNMEHATRMSTINEAIDYAKSTGDYTKANQLWQRIAKDSESHFGRVWKKFDAYQEGLRKGAEQAGMKYPREVQNSFSGIQKGWKEFFDFRNSEYNALFSGNKEDIAGGLSKLQSELDNRYSKMMKEEDRLMQQIDDLMTDSLPDAVQSSMYRNYRDQAAQLRLSDREKTAEFFKQVRGLDSSEAPDAWQKFWTERMTRVEQIRQLEMRGSAALQGDSQSIGMFMGAQTPAPAEGAEDIFSMANRFGIPSATQRGERNNRRILATVNKYLPEGTEKFKKVEDIPMEIAQQAFDARAAAKGEEIAGATRAFIPDAERHFPDPMPIETGLSELNYGRGYASIDALMDEAMTVGSKKSALLKDLPEDIQKKVMQWKTQVDGEMSGFRSAGVQYAAFRRDSALLNYNRRTNFDTMLGNIAPFAFWTTHSVANWAIYSIDRPAMLTTYLRMRKFMETAGLQDQNVPQRLKGNIRVDLPFTPEWMGDTFVNPTRFLLPFDGFMMPWEQAQSGKFRTESKVKETLGQMLEQGQISQDAYKNAIESQDGEDWDAALAQVQEGGDNYDAMDFISMTMTPHAPLMWAYNAANGTPQDIGPFTPLSKTARNVATMMGVDDWSNSNYNVEGKIRKSMGLPAFDKWDDYRVGRSISNMAAEGKYSMDLINEAMQVAAQVEAGKMDSADAVKMSKVYAEATKRSNQEAAGGWAGTILSALGIPVKAYPEGEQMQRELGEQFSAAYEEYENGNVEALTDFFDEHPEYESRLALFKSPEERLKNFMVDNLWARWNELPKVNQDELKEQLGDNFANKFINKETRSYETISPLQLQVWLKLAGGKPVGSLTADQEVMAELNQIRLTEPETAWRVETFYSMRKSEHPDWYKLQNAYYATPENKRSEFLRENPELREYWNDRRDWMTKNPDLVRYLTDDEKQIKKYENMQRKPQLAVPTVNEIKAQMSPEMGELISGYQGGQTLPQAVNIYMQSLAQQYGISQRDLIGILTGQAIP